MGRPNGATDAPERPLSSSGSPPGHKGRTPRPSTTTGGPTTFFLKSEEEVENMSATPPETVQDSTYGVQSLQSNISAADEADGPQPSEHVIGESDEGAEETEDYEKSDPEPDSPEVETLHRQRSIDWSANNSPSRPLPYNRSAPRLAFPLVPLQFYSHSNVDTESVPLSTPRSASLRSLRLSDEDSVLDETGSQAIASSSGEEDNDVLPTQDEAEGAPQLVMPSIKMPSRRAFTDRGKAMGKLKIMVVGPQGAGKTSLIKSIVQICQDIVHVDSLGPSLSTSSQTQTGERQRNDQATLKATRQLTEISASTRAYPSWWSGIEDSKVLRRKGSAEDLVLERNLVFLDTPGYTRTETHQENLSYLVQHVEKLLHRNASFTSLSDSEILSILSGNGGVQIDLILFVLDKKPTSRETELLKQLCALTNVIPLLSKADLLTPEETSDWWSSLIEQMSSFEMNPSFFGTPILQTSTTQQNSVPFAVSSAPSTDHDNMDASLLMSPDYVQPLIPSDLETLVDRIFNPDTTAWLRHSSAKKFIQWRNINLSSRPPSMSLNTLYPQRVSSPTAGIYHSAATSSATSSVLCPPSPVIVSHPLHPSASQALIRVNDRPQREDHLAHLRVARWATDLQRGINNERNRFAQRQHGLNRMPSKDELGEESSENNQIAINTGCFPRSRRYSGLRTEKSRYSTLDPTDPLGVLDWDERIRRRLALVLKIVGGCGVIGAVTVWFLKKWSWWEPAGFTSSDGSVNESALSFIGAGAGAGVGSTLVGWLGSVIYLS